MRAARPLATCTVLAALALAGCRDASPPPATQATDAGSQTRVVATIPPLEWIVRGLAPEAHVSTLLPPGASEHGYEPPPSRLADLARADVVLMVGLGLEPAADRALRTAPRGGRAVVVFADVLGDTTHDAHADDAHAHDHAHPIGPGDPHLWLEPGLMRAMVDAAHDALARRLGRQGADDDALARLAARRDALHAEVDAIDALYRERLAPFRAGVLVTAHDAPRRLAARYGLRVVAVAHGHEGAEPTPGALREALDALRGADHRAILTEPQSSPAALRRLAEQSSAPVAVFDPLGSGDWPATMRANLDALVGALSAAPH